MQPKLIHTLALQAAVDAQSAPDLHRVYPHTRCFAGPALHRAHWGLIMVRHRATVDYSVTIARLMQEAEALP